MGNVINRLSGATERELQQELQREREGRLRAEEGRLRAEEGKVRAEEGRLRAEEGRLRAEEGKVRAEEGKVRAEEGKVRAEAQNIGEYYSLVKDVWTDTNEASYEESDFTALRRQSVHPYYDVCVKAAEGNTTLIPALSAGRGSFAPGSSMESLESDSLTAENRKKRLHSIMIDGTANESAEIAHLLPHASSCSNLWAALIEAGVGVDYSTEEGDKKRLKRQVLVHGLHEPDGNGKFHRMKGTGVKHCQTNMARVCQQKQFLDFNPSLLILPILSLQDTLNYERGEYSVLVVADRPSVYKETLLNSNYDICDHNDIKVASSTLASFIKGVAHVLQNEISDEDIEKLTSSNPREKKAIEHTRNHLKTNGTVIIPNDKQIQKQNLKVMKLHFDLQKEDTHQECDPFLLFLKATVVWSSINNQKLLPDCPLPHDCEECLERNLFECQCEMDDPGSPVHPIPSVIEIRSSVEEVLTREEKFELIDVL